MTEQEKDPFWNQRHTHELLFTGAFNSLRKRGFRYAKLYASNYITYERDEIWIWKRGSFVVIKDTGNHSGAILEYLIQTNFETPSDQPFLNLAIDYLTGRIAAYKEELHENLHLFSDLPLGERFKKHRRFQQVWLDCQTLKTLKELYQNDEIIAKPLPDVTLSETE